MKGFATGFLSFLLSLSIAALGLAFMLNTTILNPDFVTSELEKFDAYSLAREQVEKYFTAQIPQGFEFMAEAVDATFDELEPWLKEQVRNSVDSTYDYLKGKSESLTLVINTEPIKESLKENVWEAIQKSPPPELAGVPPAMVEQLFNQFYDQQIGNMIPSKFEVNESQLPPETMGILQQIRQSVGYIQTTFRASLAVAILSVLGIILLKREVRGSTRKLGITFTVYGAIWFGGILAAKYFVTPQLGQLGFAIPAQLQTQIPQLIEDIVTPLAMYSLGFLIAGVVLLIVSHVYKRHQPTY